MNRKYLLLAALASAMTVSAQDVYEIENLTTSDLNGTARFVGMGGAMSALGADLSTMSSNPAGMALYRRSDVAVTGGFRKNMDQGDVLGHSPTKGSFDQIGFVYSANLHDNDLRFFNFGFSYHRMKNNNTLYTASGNLGGLSQSLEMLDLSYDYVNGGYLDLGYADDRWLTSPLPGLGYDVGMLLPITDAEGKVTGYLPVEGNRYRYQRAQWGGINQYDFNLSANIRDRFYIGATVGLYDVNLKTSFDYEETFDNQQGNYLEQVDKVIDGTGVDFKAGIIYRPILNSSFRIGLSFSTPIFYNLSSYASVYMKSNINEALENPRLYDQGDAISYNVNTPWKVNVSLGGTVSKYLAIGAEYEYANYGSSKVKYDDYYDYWSDNSKDYALEAETKRCLNKVHTLRIGAEAQLPYNIQLRVGYNHVTAPMKDDASLDLCINSSSMVYAVNTDYLNLGAINRYTVGLGFRGKHLYFDAAYQYQQQDGEFAPFYVPDASGQNQMAAQKISLNRQSANFTLGYKF